MRRRMRLAVEKVLKFRKRKMQRMRRNDSEEENDSKKG